MNKKYNQKLIKKYPQKLQHCLNDFRKSWSEFDQISKICENWINIIGLELSKECKPLKIEKKTLTIKVNHPQWRQALIYNKHIIKNNIANQLGINLDQIKIMQSYEDRKSPNNQESKLVWENHPSRIEKNNLVICDFCRSPSQKVKY